MKNKLVDLSKISTIASIDGLKYTRHQLIIKISSDCNLLDPDPNEYLSQKRMLRNGWGRKRKFIWVDYRRGVVRDQHYNYFAVIRLGQSIDRNNNIQLSLF